MTMSDKGLNSIDQKSKFKSPALDFVLDHALGAFLGVAVGDALGATTEFMTPNEIRTKYRVHSKIIGGGWLHLKPGRVTDDTEMSLALARAILAHNGWDLVTAADAFLAWMRNKPVDIGATVRRGIRDYMLKGQTEVPPREWDAGNGAVMRMVPVTLYTLGDDHLLQDIAIAQAHLTHNHPLSDAACIAAGRMVHAALMGVDRFRLHEHTRELVAVHPKFHFNNYDGQAGGYVAETMRTVFHFLFSTATFEECLVGVVNQGGDADTTGAIAGMLAGAFYGRHAIPKRWIKRLDQKVRQEVEVSTEQLVRMSPWFKKKIEC
jgi:ADP-ribosyl-[dinitrogen reductase] hydrolase